MYIVFFEGEQFFSRKVLLWDT